MNVIKKIGLSGVVGFKPTVLPIQPGITYLYGKNMLRHGNGNAAGKSVFASSTAGIFYDTPIVGERADKLKAGVRMIEFVRGKKTVSIKLGYKGKTEQLRIEVDGKIVKGATPSKTRSLLHQYWPVSEDEYRTYGHLDAKIPHPLVLGNTAQRKAFFTSFFQLDKLDAERKVLAAYGSELKKVRARWNELNTTFMAVKSDMLKKAERLELEEQVGVLGARLKKLRSKSDRAQQVTSLLEFERYAGQKIERLKALTSDFDLSTLKGLMKETGDRLKTALKANEQLDAWRLYRKELEAYEAAIDGLDMEVSLSTLRTQADGYARAQVEARMADGLEAPSKSPKKVEKPDRSKEELAKDRVRLDHLKSHAKKFSRGVCGECGQEVEKPDPEAIAKLTKRVVDLADEWEGYDQYTTRKARYDADVKSYTEAKAAAERAETSASKFKAGAALYKKRQHLVKPERVDKPKGAEETEPLRKQIELLEFGVEHWEQIETLAGLTAEERELKFDGTKLNELQDKMSGAKTRLQVHNTVKGRATDMRTRLAELDAQLADEEALALVLEAYSDKAIKRDVVAVISDRMMATVNKLSTLVFDNYRFEFIWDTQIKLIVHRPTGSSDVRSLSGSESVLFTLILVFSLMMFVPSSKRLSLLILDEPCASFHEDTIALFHALLPHLNQLIPSILVVSPKKYERYKGAREYTVYRDKTGASLKRGHPNDL